MMPQEKDPKNRFKQYQPVNEDTLEDFVDFTSKDERNGYNLAITMTSARIASMLKTAKDYASLRKELLQFHKKIGTAYELIESYELEKYISDLKGPNSANSSPQP